MPALKNIRHEKFCQNLAKGMSKSEAYVTAGYDPKHPDQAAQQLYRNIKVQSRLKELKGKASEKFELTRDDLIKFHLEMMEKGEKHSDRINSAREAGKLIGAYEKDNLQRKPVTKVEVK